MGSIFTLKQFAIASHRARGSIAGRAMNRVAANPRRHGIFAPA
jgi:hypothetical protein